MDRIRQICELLSKHIAIPKTELEYMSDYTFVLAVVMSAQTTDVQVNKVTKRLFAEYSTIDDFLNLGEEKLREKISSIGLYKSKAKHIIELSRRLKECFNSTVPNNREDLESLPGVGRKSANVILNTLFNQPTIAVDTHVLRLSKLLGLSKGNNPLSVERDLEKCIPDEYKTDISNLLILHGRYTCKARKPNCSNCVISYLCSSSRAE